MSTREKVLVGLMVAAVCLGTLILIGDYQKRSTTTAAPAAANTLTQMLTRLTAQFGNDAKLEEHRYVLSAARTPWQAGLFLTGADGLSAPDETVAPADMLPSNISLVYSGYIETSQRRVAIINGIEYIEGEMLDKTQIVVRRIDSKHVVLGASANKVFSVPLADDWESQAP